MRQLIFEGKFCRVIRVNDTQRNEVNYVTETPDGIDGLGHVRWGSGTAHIGDALRELAVEINRLAVENDNLRENYKNYIDAQSKATPNVAINKKK